MVDPVPVLLCGPPSTSILPFPNVVHASPEHPLLVNAGFMATACPVSGHTQQLPFFVAFKVSSLWINPGGCNGILPEIFDNLQPFKTLAAHPLEKIDTQ